LAATRTEPERAREQYITAAEPADGLR